MTKPFSEVVPVPDCAPGCVLIFPPWRHRCYLESKTNPGWTKLVENTSVNIFVKVFLTNLRIDQLLLNLTKCEVAPSVVAVWLGGDPRWRPQCRQTGKRPTPAAGGTKTIFHTTWEVWGGSGCSFLGFISPLVFAHEQGIECGLGLLLLLLHPRHPPTQMISCEL